MALREIWKIVPPGFLERQRRMYASAHLLAPQGYFSPFDPASNPCYPRAAYPTVFTHRPSTPATKKGPTASTVDRRFSTAQQALMKFDPQDGSEKPYPSHAEQYREYHGKATAWLFNPWTGQRRLAGDVGSDILGRLIANE